MSSITIKNLPPAVMDGLKEKARRNRRSLNNEIIVILEQNLGLREAESRENASRVQDIASGYLTGSKVVPASQAGKTPLRGLPVVYHEPFQGVEEDAWDALIK